ncbi:MAG: insulinase family protein [Chloroflexi bacterium]|nr:MAG: insulinase family protein [Chloroflexota bacterium]
MANPAAAAEVRVLSGGTRLISVPLPERASVAVAFMVKVGSRYEDDARSGLSHFVEHMAFKGGGRYPTARDVSEAIEGVGGVLNAATDREATVFWTRVPKSHLRLAISVLVDMLVQPALDPAEVVKERQVVIEELRMYQDNPQEYVQIVFDEVMWPGHPLGRDVAGREETVRAFTADDCQAHLAAHLRPDTLVVSIAGAHDADEAAACVDAEVRAWADRARSPRGPAAPAAAPFGEPLRVVRRAAEQANVLVGARAPSYFDTDRYVVDILNVLLGEGMSSRLFLELRERRGLVYDVHSFVSRLADTGVMGISLGCEPRRAATALRAALAEWRQLAAEPVPAAELTKAKEYAKGRLLLQLESTSALCEFAGQQELLTDKIITADEVVARLDDVDATGVQRVAQRLLAGGLRAAVVGPFRGESRFAAALVE